MVAFVEAPRVEPGCARQLVGTSGRSAHALEESRRLLADHGRGSLGCSDPVALEDVSDGGQRRRAQPEERVRSRGERRRDLPWDCEDLAPLLEREVRGDERAAALSGLGVLATASR